MTTNLPVTVRSVEISDYARWQELFRAYAAFYKVELDADAMATVWAWIFDPVEPFWCDVACLPSGEIAGIVQYQSMHRSLGGGMVCYLSDLYVDPKTRGRRIGRTLIDHVLEFARGEGMKNVRWLTQENNYAARTLYDTYAPKTPFILYSVNT